MPMEEPNTENGCKMLMTLCGRVTDAEVDGDGCEYEALEVLHEVVEGTKTCMRVALAEWGEGMQGLKQRSGSRI